MNDIYSFLPMKVKESSPHCGATPQMIYEFIKKIENCSQETFNVVTLDVKMRIIGLHLVSLGTLNGCMVHPREVFRVALTDNAYAIVLAHNHPSGDPAPSSNDIAMTKRLVNAGKLMSIPVHDHIIVGKKSKHWLGYLSLRESELVRFDFKEES
jgi:DNA repair protein RadC